MTMKRLAVLGLPVLMLALAAGCSSDDDDGDTGGTTTGGDTGGGDTGGGDTGGGDTGGGAGGDSGVATTPFDRVGRPGVSTALIASDADKDAYNANGDPSTWDSSFRAPMESRMMVVDGLDGTEGNALLGDTSALASILLDDRLRIDTSVPECTNYLALEIQLGGCGGRTLESDVIDDTLQHLVAQGMPVSDLADFADENPMPLTEWPFLAPPNAATTP